MQYNCFGLKMTFPPFLDFFQKIMRFGAAEVHYFMVYIAYYTELETTHWSRK